MENHNYYQVLEIPPTASQEEIVQAYRRLARRFHPDLQTPERKSWAEEHMKQLNEAYGVLSDPQARARYSAPVAPPFKSRRRSPSVEEWFTDVSPHRASRRVNPQRWRKFASIADFVFWMLVIDFLVIGALVLFVAWEGMFPSLGPARASELQCTCSVFWWVALIAALIKLIPRRKW